MTELPAPKDWGSFEVESFSAYRERWPSEYDHIPDQVIETWIYRHWRDFQHWLPLRPLEWKYVAKRFTSDEVMKISHVGDWMETLAAWGNDLLERPQRKETWLGRFMLGAGTSPAPMIVAEYAGRWNHPREHGQPMMREPFQIVEGHMRLAYLQAMIRAQHPAIQAEHEVLVATLPPNQSLEPTRVGKPPLAAQLQR